MARKKKTKKLRTTTPRFNATIQLNREGLRATTGNRGVGDSSLRFLGILEIVSPAISSPRLHACSTIDVTTECNGAAKPDERPTNFNLSRNDFEHVAHFQADSNARGNERKSGKRPVAPGEEGGKAEVLPLPPPFFVRAKIRFICVTARCVIRARLKVTQVLFPA